MKRLLTLTVSMLFAVGASSQTSTLRDQLYQSFLTPPDSIRVGCYYYWVNERVDPKGVVTDLKWMKDNGITLAFLATDIRNRDRVENPWEGQIFGKNKFQSRLWWKNLRTALKTAGELGIEMGIFNCPGWSQSGGPWIKPEEAMRNWTPQGIEICKTKEGTDVTCGPCSPEAKGLEVDKLSKTHVQKHFEAFFGEILRRIPSEDRPTLTTVVVDSWERGKQNYTDSIYVKFCQRFGYELDYNEISNLKSQTSKDLNQLISDLVASEYVGGLTEKAHEYGLRTWCEPYAHSPFPGNSITYGSAADEVGAEFWVNDTKYRKKEVDAALWSARRSGKNRVWAESFTDGWPIAAKDDWNFEKLKPIADRYFHAGINASILHVVISQPSDDREPAVRPWFGTFFDRRSAHASDVKPLVEYLRRCNFMLQLGKPYNNATDQRIMDDGTIIRFTDDSQFEVTFPDGTKETWNPLTLSRESFYSHYLFTYFTDNSTKGQQVCYAVSDNGLDFTPLNGGKLVIASDSISVSGGVRDPHILRGSDGWFRMVLTDMDWQKGKWSNRGIVMLRSHDLIHWEHHTVHFPARYAGRDAAKADAVWAPQTIYDPEAGKYMVYFSLHSPKGGPFATDAVYYAYANDNFTDLVGDEPQRLFAYEGPTIDTDIVRDEKGLYHVFFNTWGNGGTGRRQFLAQNLHHSENWRLLPDLMQPEGMKMKSEGSSAYPLNDGSGWVLAYDCFADGVFHFCQTTDLEHFTLVRETKTMGYFTPRHGSVIPLTDEEYQRIISYYKQ